MLEDRGLGGIELDEFLAKLFFNTSILLKNSTIFSMKHFYMLKNTWLSKMRMSYLLTNIASMRSQRLLTTGTNSPDSGFFLTGWCLIYLMILLRDL